MRKIICITGASSPIGCSIFDFFSKQDNYEIRTLSRQKWKGQKVKNHIHFLIDLTKDNTKIAQFIENCDVIFNCAGEKNETQDIELVNVEAIKKILQKKIPGKSMHWIQLSSSGVYQRDHKTASIVDENSPIKISNRYENTKYQAEKILEQESENKKIFYTIIRPSIIIGEGMGNRNLSILFKTKYFNFIFFLIGENPIANYVHTEDVARAMILASQNPETAKQKIYNVSSDCYWTEILNFIEFKGFFVVKIKFKTVQSILKLARKLTRRTDLPSLTLFSNKISYSSQKIGEELGYKAKVQIPISVYQYLK